MCIRIVRDRDYFRFYEALQLSVRQEEQLKAAIESAIGSNRIFCKPRIRAIACFTPFLSLFAEIGAYICQVIKSMTVSAFKSIALVCFDIEEYKRMLVLTQIW